MDKNTLNLRLTPPQCSQHATRSPKWAELVLTWLPRFVCVCASWLSMRFCFLVMLFQLLRSPRQLSHTQCFVCPAFYKEVVKEESWGAPTQFAGGKYRWRNQREMWAKHVIWSREREVKVQCVGLGCRLQPTEEPPPHSSLWWPPDKVKKINKIALLEPLLGLSIQGCCRFNVVQHGGLRKRGPAPSVDIKAYFKA